MNPSILTVFLAAAEKLYAKDKYAVLQIAALMEQMTRADDWQPKMDRIEDLLFGDSGDEYDITPLYFCKDGQAAETIESHHFSNDPRTMYSYVCNKMGVSSIRQVLKPEDEPDPNGTSGKSFLL